MSKTLNVFTDTITGAVVQQVIKAASIGDVADKEKIALAQARLGHFVAPLVFMEVEARQRAAACNTVEDAIATYDYLTGIGWASMVIAYIPRSVLLAALHTAHIHEDWRAYLLSRVENSGDTVPYWPAFQHFFFSEGRMAVHLAAALLSEFALHVPEMME